MYSIQALWTAAHHDLAVVFLILNNREYRILKHNMDTYRQRFGAKPDRGYPNMDLISPDLGFVDLARGLGVEAARVGRPEALRAALDKLRSARAGPISSTSPSRAAPEAALRGRVALEPVPPRGARDRAPRAVRSRRRPA